eukprot:350618-Chlamydomonas_euryale.AAC.11
MPTKYEHGQTPMAWHGMACKQHMSPVVAHGGQFHGLALYVCAALSNCARDCHLQAEVNHLSRQNARGCCAITS